MSKNVLKYIVDKRTDWAKIKLKSLNTHEMTKNQNWKSQYH